MASGIGTVEIKKERGELKLQGLGKTPRGVKFIRSIETFQAKPGDKKAIKAELPGLVEKLLA